MISISKDVESPPIEIDLAAEEVDGRDAKKTTTSVSYTHLTLPTKRIV